MFSALLGEEEGIQRLLILLQRGRLRLRLRLGLGPIIPDIVWFGEFLIPIELFRLALGFGFILPQVIGLDVPVLAIFDWLGNGF
jgi:hypothetical protein